MDTHFGEDNLLLLFFFTYGHVLYFFLLVGG